MKYKNIHYLEYGFIFLYIVGFIIAYRYFTGSYESKLIFSISLPLFYLIWSVLHHYFEGRLNLPIFMEYLSISLFIFIILFTASNI